MKFGQVALAVAMLLSGCDTRADVASIGSRDLPPGASYRVTGTVSVGGRVGGMAVDSSTGTLYASTSDGISVIDASTRTVVADIPVGFDSQDVAVDPVTHTVYVLNARDNSVSVIDGVARALTATVPVGKNPSGIAVDPVAHRVYVTLEGDQELSVIDGTTRSVIDSLQVVPTQAGMQNHLSGVAVDPETDRVYVSSWRSPEDELPYSSEHLVTVFDGSTRAVTATVVAGRGQNGLAVDSRAHVVYVVNGWDKAIAVIDGSTVTATVPVDVAHYLAEPLAVDSGTNTVYVIPYRANSVDVIDAARRTVVATVPVGEPLTGLVVDSVTHRVYVTQRDGPMSIIESVPG